MTKKGPPFLKTVLKTKNPVLHVTTSVIGWAARSVERQTEDLKVGRSKLSPVIFLPFAGTA